MQAEILQLLGAGLSSPEIADRLFITRKTVETHMGNLLAKLGLRNRAEAAAFATRQISARNWGTSPILPGRHGPHPALEVDWLKEGCDAMRYQLLGPSGLRVSELCLGTMSFGDAWSFGADEKESHPDP